MQETIKTGRKYRKCIDNTSGNKKWERYSFWSKASDVEFNDGTTVENKMGSFKGVTTNENQSAGYAADVTLLKSIKTALTNSITSVSTSVTNLNNLITSVSNRLGGMRFYEDSTGKYVVGADSVPKKLGSVPDIITQLNNTSYTTENVNYDEKNRTDVQQWKNYRNLIFDIKSSYPNYASLTVDNFYFCITKSNISHYIDAGTNIYDPSPFTMEKEYNPSTGTLKIKNVDGGSYERNSNSAGGRIAFDITEFKLLIL